MLVKTFNFNADKEALRMNLLLQHENTNKIRLFSDENLCHCSWWSDDLRALDTKSCEEFNIQAIIFQRIKDFMKMYARNGAF